MKSKNLLLFCLALIVALSLTCTLLAEEQSALGKKLLRNFNAFEPSAPLLPANISVKPGFAVGPGSSIGQVQMIQGNVFVVHKDQSVAYKAKKKTPLFAGDMLVSSKKSRLSAVMNDNSVLALAPNSKLVIDKSVYDPKKQTRSAVMRVLFGQVRFIVKKVSGAPDFTVNTRTAVCGVRGTDFAVSVIPESETVSGRPGFWARFSLIKKAYAVGEEAPVTTTVVTGADSTVSLAGTVGSEVVVGPSSVAAAATGAAATTPAYVGAAAAAALGLVGPGLASMSMPPGFD